jgi:hypothetical protein
MKKTVQSMALYLRRRWRRLVAELPDRVVKRQVEGFWPVTTFDPAAARRLMEMSSEMGSEMSSDDASSDE